MRFLRTLLPTLILLAPTLFAQGTGSITGTVRDNTGAVVAKADVSLTNTATLTVLKTTTNSDGEYLFAAIPPGVYDLSVSAVGFNTYDAKGIVLRVSQRARADATLAVGEVKTTVTVEAANVTQVETESSEVSGVVTGREISQLVLNGRNYTQLIALTPGVSQQNGQEEGTVGVYGSVAWSVNGGRTEYNNWELDGGDNMDNGSNGTLNVYPSVDSISEFKVLTSNYGAQYGRNGSGTVEVETKSGTRAFHGDAYEFVRNDMFNALDYADQPSHGGSGKVPPYKKNDFGYTFGGPVYIPGVYNTNKEKTFFFWSQEWRRERVPNSFNQQVPYSAERTGDFSDLCLPTTGPECPTDPRSGAPWNGALGPLPVAPAAQVLLQLIPVATPGNDIPGKATFIENVTQPTSWREELVRVDHNINSKNRATFRYIHDSWNTVNTTPIWTGSAFPTVTQAFNGPGVSVVARLTSNLSPTLLNEFVASYTTDHISFHSQGNNWQRPSDFSTVMGSFPSANNYGGKLPAINIGTGAAYGGGFYMDPDGSWPEGPYNANPTYTLRDNMTKIVGRHNLQFGAYFVQGQKNELSTLNVNGVLTFDTSSTISSGNAFADMLLGNIAKYQQGSNQVKFYQRYKIVEPYFQDDWRVTDRLTLNLGLRISLEGTYHEKYNHAYNWDPAAYDPATAPFIYDGNGIAPPNAPAGAVMIGGTAGALVTDAAGNVIGNPFDGLVHCGGPATVSIAGMPGAAVGSTSNDSCVQGHLFNAGPRVGFAWDPWGNGKTAIRGGYGIFYEHANGNEANTEGLMEGGQSSPLLQQQSQVNIPGYTNIGSAAVGPAPSFPIQFMGIPTKATWPYVQQWHLDVQHELPYHTVMTVSYVGSKGTKLGRQRDLNQLYPANQNPYQPGQPITAIDCSGVSLSGDGSATAIAKSGGGTTYQTGQVGGWANNLNVACGNDPNPYRPFYGIATITRLENFASSTYHALQVSGRKSVGSLNLTAAYTYSHSIDDSSDRYDGGFVNSYNPAMTRASSNFDERHMLNIGWVYDLPIFKKPGLSNKILGGWQWSGIETFATGTPVNITNGTTYGDNAGVGNGVGTGSYPDRIGNPDANIPPPSLLDSNSAAKFAYNPSAFALPTGLTFGDAGRNALRNPRRLNFDMALFKHFTIKENMAFELRAEGFNIFNHSEWNGYPSSMSCAGGVPPYSAGDTAACLGPNSASPSNFLEINGAHIARIWQFGAKFLF